MVNEAAQNYEATYAHHNAHDPRQNFVVGGTPHDAELDLRKFLLIIWRKKLLIFGVMLILLSLISMFLKTVEPRYTARALVLIQSLQLDPSPEIRELVRNMRVDTTFLLSEAEVLKSRSLALSVLNKLEAMNLASKAPVEKQTKSNGPKRSEQALHDLLGAPQTQTVRRKIENSESNFKSLSLGGAAQFNPLSSPFADAEKGRAIDGFLNNLHAQLIPGSSVIQVEYNSRDPDKASLISNLVVDTYIEQRLERRFQSTKKITEWLDVRLESLRKQLKESEDAVQRYRDKNNYTLGARAEITAQQLSELNTQLVLAKTKLAEAKARLDQLKGAKGNFEAAEVSSEVLRSRLIQDLKVQESIILRKKADLQSRYGEKHPRIINIEQEIFDLRQKIDSEIERIARGIKSEMEIARARVYSLETSLEGLEESRHEQNESTKELKELEREVDSNRVIFDTFLRTYKRSHDKEKLQQSQARVISYATVPTRPSYPNKPLFMALTAVASFFLSIIIILFLEKLDNAFKTSLQLEKETGYPCYAVVPIAKGRDRKTLTEYVVDKPASSVAEAIRTLRMVLNVRAQRDGQHPKIVTVTSSIPEEGKTTLALWLARMAANSGEKVILLECDLRTPNIQRLMGQKRGNTIIEYFNEDLPLKEVVHKDKESGAHVIFARPVSGLALDILGSQRMHDLLQALRQSYDLVILDSPACLSVSDARVLAKQSDHLLFTVRWDKTPREIVKAGVKQFADFGYHALSFVLTSVDIKRHARYGYGDTVQIYRRDKGRNTP